MKKGKKNNPFLKELEALKRLMTETDEFHKIQNYFFDHMAEKKSFLEYSKITEKEELKQIVAFICERLFKKKPTIVLFMMMTIPDYPFFHGSFFVEGHIAAFFYFQEIDMGMLSVSFGEQTSHIRFSMIKRCTKDELINISPYRSRTLH